MASKQFMRATRTVRAPIRTNARQIRFQSSGPNVSEGTKQAAANSSQGLVGGLAGGALVFAAGYGYYSYSGAKSIVDSATTTKQKFSNLTASMKEAAPEPSEALKWFRNTVQQYATFIPGAKQYVDAAFDDLDKIEQNHRGEVEKIVTKAYSEMREATKSGLTMETAAKSWEILQKYMQQLAQLAADAGSEVLDNHPEIKDKVQGNLDELKDMASKYGPDAKKEWDNTYEQVSKIIAGGVGVSTLPEIKKLIDDKRSKLQGFADEAWKKGLEQAQPFLEKKPELKKFVEENADALKSGKFSDVLEKIKSGDMDNLKEYAKSLGDQAANSKYGKQAQEYIKMIPGGSEIIPKLQNLQKVAEKHGDEAQKILKDTYKEIGEILQKKADEVQKLAGEAKEDAKKESKK